MAIFDFLKKKKGKEVGKKETKKEVKKEEKPLKKKEEIGIEAPKARKKISEKAHQTLYSPHVTEKATLLIEDNKYVFKVWPKTNKNEVKKSVEGLYGVDVIGVRIINVPKRQRRLGKQVGWRKGYKKAIVKIKKGQKIEILPR